MMKDAMRYGSQEATRAEIVGMGATCTTAADRAGNAYKADKGKTRTNAVSLAILLLLITLMFLCPGCTGDGEHFVGVWDLHEVESENTDASLSPDEVEALHVLGMDTYLNLDADGSLTLVNFDKALRGNWNATGQRTAKATIDGQEASILIEGDQLSLTQQDVTLKFNRGIDKELVTIDERTQGKPQSHDQEPEEAGTTDKTSGLSDMVVRGTLFSEPLTFVDDDICTIVIDGTGVDKWGDPGYNLQITNNSSTNIDIWIKDAFTVDGKQVRAYLCETVSPQRSLTTFIQFDTDDLGSTSVASLQKIMGTILVDNIEGITIARYPVLL